MMGWTGRVWDVGGVAGGCAWEGVSGRERS